MILFFFMKNFILLSTQQQQISEDSGKILFNTQLSGLFFLSEKKNKKKLKLLAEDPYTSWNIKLSNSSNKL